MAYINEQLLPGDPRHGCNGYCNYRCRCDVCRRDWAEYCWERKQLRAQNLADGRVEVEHGKGSTYRNYSCRCEPCTAANSDDARRWSRARAGA